MTNSSENQQETMLDQAVADGGAYELIRKRLLDQGQVLETKLNKLNQERETEFGKTQLEVIGRIRVRTNNNCIPRDIVRVNDMLLFGYNVFIGLKKETKIEDVFSLYKLKTDEGFDVEQINSHNTFLSDAKFSADFQELYAYYKNAQLIQLQVRNQKLLASFQIGNNLEDKRVFRWALNNEGDVKYIDNRGERDLLIVPSHDFEWQPTTREDQIYGSYPHISIADEVFVETINGNLTVKVENNTEDGFGIYQENVDDEHQSLDDADVAYAKLGVLILLKIRPYREERWRYLIFNRRTNTVTRCDAIGQACVQLPEDHGIIFPGGYYLQNGDTKVFEENISGLRFKRKIGSPNGEDVLYIFYEEVEGQVALFSYNLIQKQLQNPIYAHGYSLFENGQAVIFKCESNESTRVHPMQVWQTPFVSDEFAQAMPASQTFFGKIGNPELVRGVSELYSIKRAISVQKPSLALYEDLIASCSRVFDNFYWLDANEVDNLASTLRQISETAELVLDEFEKVQSIQAQAQKALSDSQIEQQRILKHVRVQQWQTPQQFAEALVTLRQQLGHLQTIREYRYMDLAKVDQLDSEIRTEQDTLGAKTIQFLSNETALKPYHIEIEALQTKIASLETVADLTPELQRLEGIGEGLDLLNETLGSIKVDDVTKRTVILEAISTVYAKLNQTKAQATIRRKELSSGEAVAEFSAQFALLSQSITSALSIADTPEKCDEQLSRLSIQLEELEGRFSEFDEFLADILTKREELYDTFESRKQALLDEQHRRAQNLVNAADRIFSGIERRTQKFSETDELNTYFSSDAMVLKIKELVMQLRKLNDNVNADDLEAKIKALKEQAIRSLRDKKDIFEDGGNVIKLGKHRFSVNTQGLDMTMVKHGENLAIHLTGTDFVEEIEKSKLAGLSQYWDQSLISETPQVYRAEYLAAQIIAETEKPNGQFDFEHLLQASLQTDTLNQLVRKFASPRYQEGYEKGVHDADCVVLLRKLLPLRDQAGLLRFAPKSRALAVVFWSMIDDSDIKRSWQEQARSAKQLDNSFTLKNAFEHIANDIYQAMLKVLPEYMFPVEEAVYMQASRYLAIELATDKIAFVTSAFADSLVTGLLDHLEKIGHRRQYMTTIDNLQQQPYALWSLTEAWLNGYVTFKQLSAQQRYIPEAISVLVANNVDRQLSNVELVFEVGGLLGDHPRINNRKLNISLDEFEERLNYHQTVVFEGFKTFQQARQNLLEQEKAYLRLDSFQARPLSSFVRNKLINDVYLSIIGDNLAKQMGTVGDSKRTDLMGLLLLISPPGYGKTTLMEYMADRLGLIFVKVNCPSLGHEVHSLDPANAPNATAKQELEKLNLAFEMGNNVMLYLDDIQHTHAEFLQKFISLCDGTRRIEGVWKERTKTYDLRGKKFCVIMAGNPYTESGEVFKIPDMLANRADIYNLGDVLSGRDEVFALSYIENALTSNPVLAPLATREMSDVYKIINMAKGANVATTDLSHSYSSAELNEIVNVVSKLFIIQDMVLKVNQAYIASAATAEQYRAEPAFKLQGSYRNMNKMAEKIVAVMDDNELQDLIDDHYTGEAQLLTTGAEENLLKLAHIRGTQSAEQQQRWQKILKDFARIKATGGEDVDGATKVANQIAGLSDELKSIYTAMNSEESLSKPFAELSAQVNGIRQLMEKANVNVQVVNQPTPGIESVFKQLADTIDTTFMPVVKAMNHKIDLDLNILHKVSELSTQLRDYRSPGPKTSKKSHAPLQSGTAAVNPTSKPKPKPTNE